MKYHVAMFFHFWIKMRKEYQQYCKTDYSHDCKKPKGSVSNLKEKALKKILISCQCLHG